MTISIFEQIALHTPKPTDAEIELQQKLDHNRNPHNDAHKPPLRSKLEIECDLRFEFAKTFLRRFERERDSLWDNFHEAVTRT